MTYRQHCTTIISLLRENSATLGVPVADITRGNYESKPHSSKFVAVYVEPITAETGESARFYLPTAEITLFCGWDQSDSDSSSVGAVELAEKAIAILTDRGYAFHSHPEFIDEYDNIAVVAVNLRFNYEVHYAV